MKTARFHAFAIIAFCLMCAAPPAVAQIDIDAFRDAYTRFRQSADAGAVPRLADSRTADLLTEVANRAKTVSSRQSPSDLALLSNTCAGLRSLARDYYEKAVFMSQDGKFMKNVLANQDELAPLYAAEYKCMASFMKSSYDRSLYLKPGQATPSLMRQITADTQSTMLQKLSYAIGFAGPQSISLKNRQIVASALMENASTLAYILARPQREKLAGWATTTSQTADPSIRPYLDNLAKVLGQEDSPSFFTLKLRCTGDPNACQHALLPGGAAFNDAVTRLQAVLGPYRAQGRMPKEADPGVGSFFKTVTDSTAVFGDMPYWVENAERRDVYDMCAQTANLLGAYQSITPDGVQNRLEYGNEISKLHDFNLRCNAQGLYSVFMFASQKSVSGTDQAAIDQFAGRAVASSGAAIVQAFDFLSTPGVDAASRQRVADALASTMPAFDETFTQNERRGILSRIRMLTARDPDSTRLLSPVLQSMDLNDCRMLCALRQPARNAR